MRLTLTRRCRECGCDDRHACIDQGLPCYWVSADLCSACARLAMVAQEEQPRRARKVSVGSRVFPPLNNSRRLESAFRGTETRMVLALRRNAGAGVAMPAGFARSAPSAYKVR